MQEAVLHHTAGTADTSAAEPAHDPQALRALSQQALAAGRLEEARQWAEQARAAAPEHDLHTALHLAVEHGWEDVVELLVDAGADVDGANYRLPGGGAVPVGWG